MATIDLLNSLDLTVIETETTFNRQSRALDVVRYIQSQINNGGDLHELKTVSWLGYSNTGCFSFSILIKIFAEIYKETHPTWVDNMMNCVPYWNSDKAEFQSKLQRVQEFSEEILLGNKPNPFEYLLPSPPQGTIEYDVVVVSHLNETGQDFMLELDIKLEPHKLYYFTPELAMLVKWWIKSSGATPKTEDVGGLYVWI